MLNIILGLLAAAGFSLAVFIYLKTKAVLKKTPEKEKIPVPQELILKARDEAFQVRAKAEEEARRIRQESFEIEKRLERRKGAIESKLEELEKREENISAQQRGVSKKLEDLEKLKKEELQRLEKVAGMTKDEAQKEILTSLEKSLEQETVRRIKEAEEKAKVEADERVKDILISAMQSSKTDYVSEFTTSKVKLPEEEMKGRIIGREGRNIRAFEELTGVDLDLDETPGEVRLSCFDPIRREVARIALERLIADGRIQPARIEEFVEKAKKDIAKEIHQAGEKLAYEARVPNLSPEIIDLLGRFKYRTSYGQNLISHTLETLKIGLYIASELGVNSELVRKACLLHDIGKTRTADLEGPHAKLTRKILEKYGFPEKLINAAAAHHEEEEFESPEAVIVHIADSISGSRPGARFEDYEAFVKRMKELEDAAYAFPGVEKAYAISAGREIRVVVEPKKIEDAALIKLSHDIVEKIQKEQTYPGTVKVTVIREVRATDVAK